MIKNIKSSEIKSFIENNPETVLLDVRTEDEWNTVGKPDTKDLGIKTIFITINQDLLPCNCCQFYQSPHFLEGWFYLLLASARFLLSYLTKQPHERLLEVRFPISICT